MNNKFENVLNTLNKYEGGGIRKLKNGTKMICHVPHVAPEAWLHTIYTSLSDEDINTLEDNIPVALPKDYKEFLKICNGINIFSGSLDVLGVRHSYSRIGDEAIQPYDIIDENLGAPEGAPESWLFFGGYSWDGTMVMFDLSEGTENNKVYLCARESAEILYEWNDFWSWLSEETDRLSKMFDLNGVKFDKDAPTCPLL